MVTWQGYLQALTEATGPEQVSPHYESLARSRRIIWMYFIWLSATIVSQQLGGWEYNDWVRHCIYTQEFYIAMLVGYIEMRQYAFFPGPKFTVFYETFSRYEKQQLVNDWTDAADENQNEYLHRVKEQLEYRRISNEYAHVKRRSIANFMASQRVALENSYHQRAANMIASVRRMEVTNMNTEIQKQVVQAFATVKAQIQSEGAEGELQQKSFDSALDGIRKGRMDYELDPILPLFHEEVKARTERLLQLAPEEESKMLSLTADQKRILGEADKKQKLEFLQKPPAVTNASLKANAKLREFVEKVAATR